MAFFLYQCDRIYDLRRVISEARSTVYQKTRGLTTSNDPDVYVDSEWVFGLSMIILSLVIAAKRTFTRASSPFAMDDQAQLEEEVENQRMLGVQSRMNQYSHACERITEEEFDYQTSVTTRKEIMKLVQSEAYQKAMR